MAVLGFPVIDADGHVEEYGANWEKLHKEWGDWAPRYIADDKFDAGQPRFLIEGKVFPRWEDKWGRESRPIKVNKPERYWTGRPGMTDPKQRLVDMDVEGIDIAVLFGGMLCASAIGIVERPKLALDACRAYNDWLAEYCSADPARLKGIAAAPFQDPAAAAKELKRAVRELKMVGLRVPTWPQGTNPGDRRFDPIWKVAEELGVPACLHLHSARTVGADRFDGFFLKHVFYGADVFMAFAGMLAGGVLDRFPGLKIGVFEAGCGWIPYLQDRLHEHWETFGDQLPEVKRDPAEYMASERCFYSFEPGEHMLPIVAGIIGAERLTYASDYAHIDCMCPYSVKAVAEREDLTPDVKRKILGANAARLFNLKI
ncbi:MAG TPA: amidohydrolase family protein [Burkholderiales bacterium]|jgi:predicted TIM-barrel fold metal-dependent hydrolase|nr:amidohydrolase family protein [Burkholderiales bacterium]